MAPLPSGVLWKFPVYHGMAGLLIVSDPTAPSSLELVLLKYELEHLDSLILRGYLKGHSESQMLTIDGGGWPKGTFWRPMTLE